MRYIIFLLAIFLSINSSFAGTYYNNHHDYRYNQVSHKNDINNLERKIFKQTFNYDNPNRRIERLEKKVFGACQSGTLDERLNLLQNASKNYKSYNRSYAAPQYRPPIFTGSTGSSWRNMLYGNFMNQFAGTATGFTPTLTPAMDPAFMDYFEAERAGYGDSYDYSDNHRSIHTRTNRSTGTGVRILD